MVYSEDSSQAPVLTDCRLASPASSLLYPNSFDTKLAALAYVDVSIRCSAPKTKVAFTVCISLKERA